MTPLTLVSVAELEAAGVIVARKDGNHGAQHPKTVEFVAAGVPFLMASDISEDGAVDLEGCAKLTPERASKLRIPKAQGGDVLLTHKGTLGRVALLPSDAPDVVLTPQVTFFRLNREKVCPRYFLQALRSPIFQEQLLTLGQQTTRPYVSLSAQAALKIPFPALDVQHRVAAILSAYDDLIEVNARRIAILEQVARRTFEEWFVRFRFRGPECELGVAPEGVHPRGWRWSTLGHEFRVVLGGTPSRQNECFWQNGSVPWIASGKANELRILEPSEYITEEALSRSATKMMPGGTTVLAITGATLGQVSRLSRPMCANQSVVGVIDDTGFRSDHLFWSIKFGIEAIISKASGGAQQHINKEVVCETPYLVPTSDVLTAYRELSEPNEVMVVSLLQLNANLRAQRDLLLPRLVAGRVNLLDAQAELEQAAA